MPREAAAVCDGEERNAVKIYFAEPRLFTKGEIRDHMSSFMGGEPYDGTCQERSKALPF